MMKDRILVGKHKETGLYHGLYYKNLPTPSGIDRPILWLSTKEGFTTEKEALEKIKQAYTPEYLKEIDIQEV